MASPAAIPAALTGASTVASSTDLQGYLPRDLSGYVPGESVVGGASVLRLLWLAMSGFAILALVFLFEACFLVSVFPPGTIPVHHDDYTNLSRGGTGFQWSWSRPLSYGLIHLLSAAGPGWVSAAGRVLTVTFVLLSWALLCQLTRPRAYWLMLAGFAVTVFSTPVIVEYVRYTGMITHLLSGSLGLAAVLALFRASGMSPRRRYAHGAHARRWYASAWTVHAWYLISVTLIVLSVLAKEDFILFYALSLAFAALWWPVQRFRMLSWGIAGLLLCGALIAASKRLAATRFLGVADASSPYYLDPTPGSVAHTVWRYLTGAAHPATQGHGTAVAALFMVSTLMALWLAARHRNATRSGYFALAVLALIAPYSVLPNHVNVYYELIWLPMLVALPVVAMTELYAGRTPSAVWSGRMPVLVMLAIAAIFTFVDYPARSGIAAWYDERMQTNARVLAILDSNRARINAAPAVCVSGADSFSPWFMHDGQYLLNVMGLSAIWNMLVAPDSPRRAGFDWSAAASRGKVIVVDSPDRFAPDCLHLRLEQ